MNSFDVIPLVEVGGVKFGMKREEVRKIFGNAREFKKTRFSRNTTDDFGFCHVFYNGNDECEAIEFFNGSELTMHGFVIMPSSIGELQKIITDLHEEDGCLISSSLSIGITISSNEIESILFGCSDYYVNE